MSSEKSKKEKTRLHIRNKNRERYDLNALLLVKPELKNHIKPNKIGLDTVDFSSSKAVKLLNQALLAHYYGIENWEFPDDNLCPPIPGRADYIHHMADLLAESNYGKIPPGHKVTCLDIGVGASCIYPIIGVKEYDWNFMGTDIDPKSIKSAKAIIKSNVSLMGKVKFRLQKNPNFIYYKIIKEDEKFDLAICNPPFHASAEEAIKGTRRKVKNLSGKHENKPELNFSGVSKELICEGGEKAFIQKMVRESRAFRRNCFWFSTLVSKQSNLKAIYKFLEKVQPAQVKTIPMGTGNKSSRIVAWSFFSRIKQKNWRERRWNEPQNNDE